MSIEKKIYQIKKNLIKFSALELLRGAWFSRKLTKHGVTVVRGGRPAPKVYNEGGEIITDNCQFYEGVRLEVGKDAVIRIGKGTYLNRNTVVVAKERVEIGNGCKIAWDVVIMDSDLHPIEGKEMKNKPVIIEDNVWIGCRSIILKGVTIGTGAIIAAGSVVTKHIPAYAVAAGVPAKVLAIRASEETDYRKQ